MFRLAAPVPQIDRRFSEREIRIKPGKSPVCRVGIKQTALFTIEGELDDISGNGQTEAAQSLCKGIPERDKQHFLARGVGHYGIFSGRKYREMIYPRVRDFIAKHD